MPCSQDAFERVWEAYHATRKDVVKVPLTDIAELWACDGERGTPPFILPGKRRGRLASCDRAGLFSFLKVHHT